MEPSDLWSEMAKLLTNRVGEYHPSFPKVLRAQFLALCMFRVDSPIDFGLVQTRYRILARKFHPDRGGNNEIMASVNRVYRFLIDNEALIRTVSNDPGFKAWGGRITPAYLREILGVLPNQALAMGRIKTANAILDREDEDASRASR